MSGILHQSNQLHASNELYYITKIFCHFLGTFFYGGTTKIVKIHWNQIARLNDFLNGRDTCIHIFIYPIDYSSG